MTDRELLHQALEALEWASDMIPQQKEPVCDCPICKASDALRERLAQPEQGWVGLTDEEIMEMLDYGQYGRVPQYARNFVDAIEAKLKEKNA